MAEYEVTQLEAKGGPLIDSATGKATILRKYELIIHPDLMKIESDKDLLEHFKKDTILQLWKDELELVDELRLVRNMHDKRFATIFAVCQAKPGSALHLTPQSLDNAINTKG